MTVSGQGCMNRESGFATSRVATAPHATMLVASLVLGLATGCKPVGPDYKRPDYQAPATYKESGASAVVVPPPNPAGGDWHPANPSDGMLRGNWWEIYQDPQLNRLEDRVAANNPSLRQALETYLAARDTVSAVRANLYPFLTGSASISRPRFATQTSELRYADIRDQRFRNRRTGKLGTRLLGPRSPAG